MRAPNRSHGHAGSRGGDRTERFRKFHSGLHPLEPILPRTEINYQVWADELLAKGKLYGAERGAAGV